MLRYFVPILICLFLAGRLAAQNNAVITGTIQNEKGTPMVKTTITLKSHLTATDINTVLSDSNGRFILYTGKGTYHLTITALNYAAHTIELLHIESLTDTITLNNIILKRTDAKELEAVVIKAEKPLIEQNLDRTIINVSSMIGASSGNAMQLLEKTPGVVVDGNAVSINGRGSVVIMIDSRPTYMSEGDVANYLKSIPASTVDKIELIPVPPSSYEANGSSMINIVLKKNKLKGLSGSVATGVNVGRYVRTNNAATLHYNYKKLRVSTTLSYNRDAGFSEYDYDRLFFDEPGKVESTIRQNNYTKFYSHNLGGRLGVDYAISSATNIGAIVNLNQSPLTEKMNYDTRTMDAFNQPEYNGNGFSLQKNRSLNSSYNLHGSHQFKKQGRSVSVDLNHMQYDKQSDLQLNKIAGGEESVLNYHVPLNIKIYNAQVDYVHPLAEGMGFEAGAKTARVITNNIFEMTERNDAPAELDQSNNFNYQEWVNAAYVSVNKKIKRFNGKLGLRGEQTNIKGTEPANGAIHPSWFSRSYFSLFPSAFLSYNLDSTWEKNLVLSFSRRINRPGFQQLNPFLIKQDDYNYYGGNPQLAPQFNNHIDLKYQHRNFWGITAIYSSFRQIIFQSLRVEDSIFIRQPENIARGVMAGIANNFNVAPAKWWRINANIMLVRLYLKGETFGQNIRQEMYTGRLNLFNQFPLSEKWKAELGFMYTHRDLQGQTQNKSRYRLNSAVQCEFFSGKAQMRLFADDIFRTWVQRGTTQNLQGSVLYYQSINETRMVGLSLNVRFGSKNNKTATHREATNEERERLQ